MANVSHFSIDGVQYDVAPAMPPTVGNGTLTIQKNGTNVQTFTANQSSNATANITVPTKVSELTNDSGYITDAGVTGVKGSAESSYRTGNVNLSKTNVGLGNVPNVTTNNQTPTFSQASARDNLVSGEKLSVLFGKIMKWFADLKTVAFSNSYTDLDNKPTIPTYSNGTGLNLSDTTFSVKYGTAAGTACQGNDSRLSNSRTPTAHASTATTYGIGNASNYGHVKLADTYNGTSGASTGVGASSKAVGDLASWCNDNLAHNVAYQNDLAVQCAWLKTTDGHFIGFRWSDRKILIDGTAVGSF